MSAIGPGDWVECVRARNGADWLSVGAAYRVEDIRAYSWGCCACAALDERCDQTGLLLSNLRPGGNGLGHHHCSRDFRPIYHPKASLIESLLQPVDIPAEPEGVDA